MQMHKINRFPAGNVGGIISRKSNLNESNRASINLFMEPMKDVEVMLHVEGLPSRTVLNTDKMRPVLSFDGNGEGGVWRLRLAMRDSLGENVWSPFTYANVWSGSENNANICWGRDNAIPLTFAQAWNTFFGAPFNKDLAADVGRVLSMEEWIETLPPEERTKRIPDRVLKMSARAVSGMELSSYGLMTHYEIAGYEHLKQKHRRYELMKQTIAEKRRYRDMVTGVKWVAANDKVYRKCLAMCAAVKEEIEAIDHKRNYMRGIVDEISRMTNQFLMYNADAWRAVISQDQRAFRFHHQRAYNTGHGREDWKLWSKLFMRAAREYVHFSRYYAKPGDLRNYVRSKIAEQLLNLFSRAPNRIFQERYDAYCEKMFADHLKDHFMGRKWQETLVFAPVSGHLTRWGSPLPFPPCDGTISLFGPVASLAKCDLPVFTDQFTLRDKVGRAYNLVDYGARMGFYRSLTEKVKMLFHPGVESRWLTNGTSVLKMDADKIDEQVAALEAEPPLEIDTFEIAKNAGLSPFRDERLDSPTARGHAPMEDEGEPDGDEPAVDTGDDIPYARDCACIVCVNRCGCEACFEQADQRMRPDGTVRRACECRACEYLGEREGFPRHMRRPRRAPTQELEINFAALDPEATARFRAEAAATIAENMALPAATNDAQFVNHRDQRPLREGAPFRIVTIERDEEIYGNHEGCEVEPSNGGNHCGCDQIRMGYSHAWCNSCNDHVCN